MKLLLTLLFVVSCSHAPVEKPVEVKPEQPVEKPIEVPAPEVPEVEIVKVNVISLKWFKPEQEERFRKIAANVELIINSQEFKEKMLNFSYLEKQQFVDTTDSNQQVLAKVLSSDWSLEYKLENLRKSTIGYTLPNVTWIVINSDHYHWMKDSEVAANITHEYGGHKLGRYGHAKRWNKARDYSVPYGMGYLVEKIYKERFEDVSR